MYPDNEWSGILFFKTEGDLEDISKMVFTTYDFVLQDIGSKAHTAFENEEDLIDYFQADKELLKCRMGLLHSHNNIGVFFSGEDIDELRDNTASTDFYLSLIIGNKFNPVAKIAFRGKTTTSGFQERTIKKINGESHVIRDNHHEETQVMFTADLNISVPDIAGLDIDLKRFHAKNAREVGKSWEKVEKENTRQNFPVSSSPKFGKPPYYISERQREIEFEKNGGNGLIHGEVHTVSEYHFRNFVGKAITGNFLWEESLLEACVLVKKKLTTEMDIDLWVSYVCDNIENIFMSSTEVDLVTIEDTIDMYERIVPILSTLVENNKDNEPIRKLYLEISKILKELTEEMGKEEEEEQNEQEQRARS